MSIVLSDGTVISSGFATNQQSHNAVYGARFANYAMRVGYVKEHYPPGHPKNVSGIHHEYRVVAAHFDEASGIYSTTEYPNCTIMELFGSGADYMSYTLRSSEIPEDEDFDPLRAGSMVFILCENGNGSKAYIIGSPRHPSLGVQRSGHRFEWEFNGCNFSVNDDGSVILWVRGPTNLDGSVKQGKEIGARLHIAPTGSLMVQTASGETITLQKDQIRIKADRVAVATDKMEVGANTNKREPVLRASQNYLTTANTMHESLRSFLDAVNTFCDAVQAEQLLSSLKPAAVALKTAALVLKDAVGQHDRSLSKGDAISQKLDTE